MVTTDALDSALDIRSQAGGAVRLVMLAELTIESWPCCDCGTFLVPTENGVPAPLRDRAQTWCQLFICWQCAIKNGQAAVQPREPIAVTLGGPTSDRPGFVRGVRRRLEEMGW